MTILTLPRRLAIQILHEAQIAQPEAIHGWVYADAQGLPVRYRSALEAMNLQRSEEALWARLWSNPDSPAVPSVSELREGLINLVISLDTKGVLEMRAWILDADQPLEQVLQVCD